MKHVSTRAALLAAAHLIPAGLIRKDAPDIEQLLEKHSQAVKDAMKGFEGDAEALKLKTAELTEEFRDMEQRLARRGDGGFERRTATWGSQFVQAKSEDLTRVASERGKTSMEIKAAITSSTADAAGSAGDLVVPARDQIVGMPKRRMTIRDLLTVTPVTTGSVEYPKQTARNLNAATVAEAAQKPESDLKFSLETVPMRVIAHWMKASRQILDDAPQVEGLIDSELIYGLALAEELQLLKGDGTGQNLHGMNVQATPFAAPFEPDDLVNMIDMIGLAILQSALTDNSPDGIVIHPSDWWRMRLLKDADGKYLLGDPGKVVTPSLFGLPVVPTPSQTVDKFLVGAFGPQTLYDRWSARVEVGFVDDDFTKNLVTILGEERVGFAAKRPEALIYGGFGNA